MYNLALFGEVVHIKLALVVRASGNEASDCTVDFSVVELLVYIPNV